MNLAQMYSLANSKSGYARPDGEIYDALNEGGFRVFAAVLKEFRGFFIKFDETSLTLLPGTTEYALPADLTQIVNLAERISPTNDWLPMAPLGLTSALSNIQDNVGWDTFYSGSYGDWSEFGFYGPYLDATATVAGGALQIQKIRVSPGIDTPRFCQIAYTAKWLPITDASSKIMLPDEGTYAMLNYAIGELRDASDDQSNYEAKGEKHLSSFLSWLRARQIMSPLTIRTYGPGV